jgi:hypothetical protein
MRFHCFALRNEPPGIENVSTLDQRLISHLSEIYNAARRESRAGGSTPLKINFGWKSRQYAF